MYNLGTSTGTYEANGFLVHNCGTPVLGSSFGAFTETIEHGENGYRCRTLGDWLTGIERIEAQELAPRDCIRSAAVNRYSMWNVAARYDAVFRQLGALWTEGWYSRRNALVSP